MTRALAWWTRMSGLLRDCARGEQSVDDTVRELRDELGYDAALVVLPDAGGQPSHPAFNLGYPDEVATYLAGNYVDMCPGYAWADAIQSPTRFVDLPFDFRLSPSFVDVLGPAGFDEGITLPFHVPFTSGRGFLAMSSSHAKPLDEDSRLALAMLGTSLAAIAQPESSFGREWSPAAHLLRVDGGSVRSITSDPAPAFVSQENLVVLARTLGVHRPSLGFRGQGSDLAGWRFDMFVARDSAGQRCVITRISPSPASGLTSRELDVTGAVRAGLDNARIANLLGISVRTVKTHLEHAMATLRTQNRTELAALAWAQDLSSLAVELRLATC